MVGATVSPATSKAFRCLTCGRRFTSSAALGQHGDARHPERVDMVLAEYWHDQTPFNTERQQGQAAIDALFLPHWARVRAEQEARWALEQGEQA